MMRWSPVLEMLHELNMTSFECSERRIPIFQSCQNNFNPEIFILELVSEMRIYFLC